MTQMRPRDPNKLARAITDIAMTHYLPFSLTSAE
jgi:hypothetical protein